MSFRKDILRRCLAAKGWRAAELSRRSRIAQSRLSIYLSGQEEPRGVNLEALADSLDVTTDFLLGRETELGPEEFKRRVSELALETLARRQRLSRAELTGLRRVLAHAATPKSTEAWSDLQGQIALYRGGRPPTTRGKMIRAATEFLSKRPKG